MKLNTLTRCKLSKSVLKLKMVFSMYLIKQSGKTNTCSLFELCDHIDFCIVFADSYVGK